MSRFVGGFALASLIWGGAAAYLHLGMGFGPPAPEPEIMDVAVEEPAPEAEEPAPRRRRRRRNRRRRARAAAEGTQTPQGNATVGDDLGEGEMRNLDMGGSGGEAQLSAAQIDAGFDGAMGRIRRCLILMAGESEVRGRLIFGLRVGPSGRVLRVRLSGPAAATTGDAGTCLSTAARRIRFPTFDGPEMVVRYPLTLE